MSSAVTPDQAIANYRDAYEQYFGCDAPAVRHLSSGGYSLKMSNGDRLKWSRIELRLMTGFYLEMKGE